MEDIVSNDLCHNMSGNKSVYISPIEDVKSITTIAANKRNVVFESGGSWGKLDLHNITVNAEMDGDGYNHSISGELRMKESKHDILNTLLKKRFITKVIDNNNKAWLIGSVSEPLNLLYNFSGPPEASGNKHYFINIFGLTTEPQFETTL